MDVRKCHSHKNQPARQQQINQIQSHREDAKEREEEEMNEFTHIS